MHKQAYVEVARCANGYGWETRSRPEWDQVRVSFWSLLIFFRCLVWGHFERIRDIQARCNIRQWWAINGIVSVYYVDSNRSKSRKVCTVREILGYQSMQKLGNDSGQSIATWMKAIPLKQPETGQQWVARVSTAWMQVVMGLWTGVGASVNGMRVMVIPHTAGKDERGW
jgi:hypothetical protein